MDSSQHRPEQHQTAETLHSLAAHIERAGLRVPVSLVLDVLQPLDVVSSQVAVFVAPFVRGLEWERYAVVLTAAASWNQLRQLLEAQAGDGSEEHG